jgi:hypothetical protein
MKKFDKIRIWIEDSVEPEGGFWCNGYLDKDLNFRQFNYDYKGKEDELDSIYQYIKWGYKIQKVKNEKL